MVAISFTVFKNKIISGEKKQTIRKWSETRVNQMKKLKVLQLYWKQRTPECELIKEVVLDEIVKVRFGPMGLMFFDDGGWNYFRIADMHQIALLDGFTDFGRMENWFFNKYNELEKQIFSLIRWRT